MKYFYYAIDNKDKDGKMYAHAWRIHESINLLSALRQFPNAIFIHQCKTKKEAESIADNWNECHKTNGCYMFATAPLF